MRKMKICKACGGELQVISKVCEYCGLDTSEESATFSDYEAYLRNLSLELRETTDNSDALNEGSNISRVIESITIPESNENLVKFSLFLVSQSKSVAGQIKSGNIGRSEELSAWLAKVDQCKNILLLKDDSFKKRQGLLNLITEVESLSSVTATVYKFYIALFSAILIIFGIIYFIVEYM
jgi:hypothetical protein